MVTERPDDVAGVHRRKFGRRLWRRAGLFGMLDAINYAALSWRYMKRLNLKIEKIMPERSRSLFCTPENSGPETVGH
jgi:hypothetical protein